jgi:peptidoglycan biosynthesis protein MviN/MurJ (putative lipid II flippase)
VLGRLTRGVRGRRAVVAITFLSACGSALALVNQVALSSIFGAGASLDALFAAVSVPLALTGAFNTAMDAVMVPTYANTLAKKRDRSASAYAMAALVVIASVLFAMYAIAVLASPVIVSLFLPGFDAAQRELTMTLVPVMGLSVALSGLSETLQRVLNFHGRFLLPPIASFLLPIVPMIFAVAGGVAAGVRFVAWGYVAGEALRLVVLAVRSRRMIVCWPDGAAWRDSLRMLRPAATLTGTNLVFGSAIVVEKTLASMLAPGSITVLYLAQKISTSVAGLTTYGVGTVAYPELARLGARNDDEGQVIGQFLARVVRAVAVVAGLLAAGAVVFGGRIFALVFGHGQMTEAATKQGGQTLMATAGMLVFATVGTLVVRSMYAENRRGVANLLNVNYLVVYACAGFFLGRLMGTPGIALAASCAVAVNYALLVLGRTRFRVSAALPLLAYPLAYFFLAGACFGVASWLWGRASLPSAMSLVLGSALGALIYVSVLIATRDAGFGSLLGRRKAA